MTSLPNATSIASSELTSRQGSYNEGQHPNVPMPASQSPKAGNLAARKKNIVKNEADGNKEGQISDVASRRGVSIPQTPHPASFRSVTSCAFFASSRTISNIAVFYLMRI
jgi:hypothetical protein